MSVRMVVGVKKKPWDSDIIRRHGMDCPAKHIFCGNGPENDYVADDSAGMAFPLRLEPSDSIFTMHLPPMEFPMTEEQFAPYAEALAFIPGYTIVPRYEHPALQEKIKIAFAEEDAAYKKKMEWYDSVANKAIREAEEHEKVRERLRAIRNEGSFKRSIREFKSNGVISAYMGVVWIAIAVFLGIIACLFIDYNVSLAITEMVKMIMSSMGLL